MRTVILAITLAGGLAACGGGSEEEQAPRPDTSVTVIQGVEAPPATGTAAPAPADSTAAATTGMDTATER